VNTKCSSLFFFKQKTAYEIGLGIPAEPLFRSNKRISTMNKKWLNMLGTFVKDWFRYESHFVHGRDSLVDILKERGLLSESDAVQIGRASCRERVEMSVGAGSLEKKDAVGTGGVPRWGTRRYASGWWLRGG